MLALPVGMNSRCSASEVSPELADEIMRVRRGWLWGASPHSASIASLPSPHLSVVSCKGLFRLF